VIHLGDWDRSILLAFPAAVTNSDTLRALEHLDQAIDRAYRLRKMEIVSCGRSVEIPERVHFLRLNPARFETRDVWGLIALCFCTRSTDGHLRQYAVQRIIGCPDCWVAPFVVLLSADYVVEIVRDLVAALPNLKRDQYVDFVRENRPLMHKLRARATSYWDCHCRPDYPEKTDYPGLVFLRALEEWAA
jgi:hypothetical protein